MAKNFAATHFPWLIMSADVDSLTDGSSTADSAADARKTFCRENPAVCRQMEAMEAEGVDGAADALNKPWGEWETFKVRGRERESNEGEAE